MDIPFPVNTEMPEFNSFASIHNDDAQFETLVEDVQCATADPLHVSDNEWQGIENKVFTEISTPSLL